MLPVLRWVPAHNRTLEYICMMAHGNKKKGCYTLALVSTTCLMLFYDAKSWNTHTVNNFCSLLLSLGLTVRLVRQSLLWDTKHRGYSRDSNRYTDLSGVLQVRDRDRDRRREEPGARLEASKLQQSSCLHSPVVASLVGSKEIWSEALMSAQ